MKRIAVICCILVSCTKPSEQFSAGQIASNQVMNYFPATDARIKYYGRFDFSNRSLPKIWMPGGYQRFLFTGTTCVVDVIDQMLNGQHNYISYSVDGGNPHRIKLSKARTALTISANRWGDHVVVVSKGSESFTGYVQFSGVHCPSLLTPAAQYWKFEFIGDSQTVGASSDQSVSPCGKGNEVDHTNNFLSYGPITARALHADYVISAVSGIGLTHLQTGGVKMPIVFDKMCMYNNTYLWNFPNYTPRIVMICLGQNDNLSDSAGFCTAYNRFIDQVRRAYPNASLVLLSSPMAGRTPLDRYLPALQRACARKGQWRTYYYLFSKRYHGGCGGHPTLAEHQQIAAELTAYLRRTFRFP